VNQHTISESNSLQGVSHSTVERRLLDRLTTGLLVAPALRRSRDIEKQVASISASVTRDSDSSEKVKVT